MAINLNVYAGIAGIGMAIVINPLQLVVAKKFAGIRQDTARQTDKRIRFISEVIQAISSVKSFNWENPFFKVINSIRQKECDQIHLSQNLRTINAALYFVSPQISVFACFVAFVYSGGTLTIPIVFSTMSLFQVLRTSIGRQWTRCIET